MTSPLERLGIKLAPGTGVAVQSSPIDLSTAALEGLTLEAYATLQAQLDHGDGGVTRLAAAGLDAPRWARIAEAWQDALGKDPSHQLTALYGRHYVAAMDPRHPALVSAASEAGPKTLR